MEAQTQISEQMDVIDQEFITRKEPAVARGVTRYRTVGTGGNDGNDDDDDSNSDNAKAYYDEDTELEDNIVDKDDDNPDNENLIIMNPNNGTGLQIKNVISVKPMDVDQPKVQEPQEKLKCAIISVGRIDSPQYKDTGATPVPRKQPVLGEQPIPGEDPMAAKQPVPEEILRSSQESNRRLEKALNKNSHHRNQRRTRKPKRGPEMRNLHRQDPRREPQSD